MMISNVTCEYYTVEATATSTDAWKTELLGKDITVYVGIVRGMTDNGQPGWVDSGPTVFKGFAEAEEYAQNCIKWFGKSAYGMTNIRDPKLMFHEVETTTIRKSKEIKL